MLIKYVTAKQSRVGTPLSMCKLWTIIGWYKEKIRTVFPLQKAQWIHMTVIDRTCVDNVFIIILTALLYLALISLFFAHFPVFLCLKVCRSNALPFSRASSFIRASSGFVFCNSSNSFSCCFSFSFLSTLKWKYWYYTGTLYLYMLRKWSVMINMDYEILTFVTLVSKVTRVKLFFLKNQSISMTCPISLELMQEFSYDRVQFFYNIRISSVYRNYPPHSCLFTRFYKSLLIIVINMIWDRIFYCL